MLSSLTLLKAAILPAAMRSRTDFDTQLTTLANAAQVLMQQHCNRRFDYADEEAHRVPGADWLSITLPCYPIVSVTSVKLIAPDAAETTITTDVQRIDKAAGLLHFQSTPGNWYDMLEVTYSGGLWSDTSEAQDGELPTGATPLPADLLAAYHLQVKHLAEAQGILTTGAAGDKTKNPAPLPALSPLVIEMLRPWRRL